MLKGHTLDHLLPYDPAVKSGKRLKNGIKEYLLLLTATENVINALKNQHFHFFDPLVGENACQIRAVMLTEIFFRRKFEPLRILEHILRIKKRINELLEDATLSSLRNVSLKNLIEEEDLKVKLNFEESFLIKCYFLSVVKVSRTHKAENPLVKNEYTDVKRIKEISNVGTMFAELFVKHLRVKVALHSVTFVQVIAYIFGETGFKKFIFSHRGLQCLPYFWMTRTLMFYALKSQIPIVLLAEQKAKNRNYETVQSIALVFRPLAKRYVETCPSSSDENVPAIFLLGSTCKDLEELPDRETWKKELVEFCPIELVLAYAAAHRQYPDPSLEALYLEKVEDQEYEYYRQKADKWGCSIANPSRFFLAHAFCDKIGKLYQSPILKQEYMGYFIQ